MRDSKIFNNKNITVGETSRNERSPRNIIAWGDRAKWKALYTRDKPGASWAILLKRNDVNLPIYYLSQVS